MTQTQKTFVVAALAALTLQAHAIVRLDTVKDDDYINFGKTFTSVGQLTGKTGYGSATLIAKDWLLTAAHVIKEDTGKPADFKFSLSGTDYEIDKFEFNPNKVWDSTKKGKGYDIALVKLKKAVGDVNPSSLYSGKWDTKTLYAADAAFSGWGRIGDGKVGDNKANDGKRRAATNAIDAIDLVNPQTNEKLIENTFMVDFDNGEDANNKMANFVPFGANNSLAQPTSLEGCTAPGDSGGGFFIKVGDAWQIAGVAESTNSSLYGAVPFFTAIRDHNDWIVNTVPEPGTMIGLGAAIGLAAVRRRRR
jgi:secreted trypsin-like serine protease